jgi:hypothetical protein
MIDDTATLIEKNGVNFFYPAFQTVSFELYVEEHLWSNPETFSWDVAFADEIYPLLANTLKMPIVKLSNTEEFFELFYDANYEEDDESNVFVYACGDGPVDIISLVNLAKAKKMRLEDALHAYVSRKHAQTAEQELATLFDPNVYFNSVSTDIGRKMIADQIAEFNRTNEYFEIKTSKYDLGLFVKKSFSKDFKNFPIFMRYTGFQIPQSVAKALPFKYDKMYELTTTDSVVPEICRIDGKEFNYFCYANDPGYEKEANVTFADYGKGAVYIEALKKDYVKGEEIFIHYGEDYWRYNVDYWGGPIQREIVLGVNVMVDLRKDNLQQVIMKANMAPGPKVVPEEDIKLGYGLQAERDYTVGTFITKYGGIENEDDNKKIRPYAVKIEHKGKFVVLDAEFQFDYRDKGRWVNEHPLNIARYGDNVNLRFDKDPTTAYFYASKDVKKGEFFYWNYGPLYKRTWKKK